MTKQQQQVSLADFDRPRRTAIVCEVIATMLDVESLGFGDALTHEDTLRMLAEAFDVPFMALHQLVDGRVTSADMVEWCRFTKAVA